MDRKVLLKGGPLKKPKVGIYGFRLITMELMVGSCRL